MARIYYFAASIIPSRTANSVHVMKMCQALARNGHRVTLFARPGSMVENAHSWYGVENIFDVVTGGSDRYFGAIGQLVRIWLCAMRQGRPDLVYGRHLYSLLSVLPWARPIIYEAHVMPATRLRRMLERLVFTSPFFVRLVVISDALKRDYLEEFPFLDDAKVVVAHDGADVVDTSPPACKTNGPRVQVGYVGHLYPGKGMEIIVEVAKRLPTIDFHIVGGEDTDIAAWRARSASCNIVYHGYIPNSELGSYYSKFDLVLAPLQKRIHIGKQRRDISRWTSPLKIFEYMAYGKPMIVSDLPVLREIVDDEIDALVVPSEDIEAWTEAVRRLAGDHPLRSRLAAAARAKLSAQFSWNIRARSVLEGI